MQIPDLWQVFRMLFTFCGSKDKCVGSMQLPSPGQRCDIDQWNAMHLSNSFRGIFSIENKVLIETHSFFRLDGNLTFVDAWQRDLFLLLLWIDLMNKCPFNLSAPSRTFIKVRKISTSVILRITGRSRFDFSASEGSSKAKFGLNTPYFCSLPYSLSMSEHSMQKYSTIVSAWAGEIATHFPWYRLLQFLHLM